MDDPRRPGGSEILIVLLGGWSLRNVVLYRPLAYDYAQLLATNAPAGVCSRESSTRQRRRDPAELPRPGSCYYCKLQAGEVQGLKPGGDRRIRAIRPPAPERSTRPTSNCWPRELKGAPPRAKTIPQSTGKSAFLRVGPPPPPRGRKHSQTNACRHNLVKEWGFQPARGRKKSVAAKPNPHWQQHWRSLAGLIRPRGMTG